VISRSTGGRPLQLDRQSLAEGGGVEPHGRDHAPGSNRAPSHPGVAFQARRERGSNSHARVGLPFSRRLPSPAIGWSLHMPSSAPGRTRTCMPARGPGLQPGGPAKLPNRRKCRSAGIPGVSAMGRCGDRMPLPRCGSGSCLMLSTIDFAPTPHHWGLGRERCPHGHVTVSPVPRCSLASRPGCGSGARGTFHDSHGRRDSNPQPPVLETGALPVELRPLAALGDSC